MDIDEFEDNSLVIVMTINEADGGLDLAVGHTIADDFDEEEKDFYLDMLNGIVINMREGIDKLAFDGMMARQLAKLTGTDINGEDLSPDMSNDRHADFLREIKELAIGPDGGNIINFKKKMH